MTINLVGLNGWLWLTGRANYFNKQIKKMLKLLLNAEKVYFSAFSQKFMCRSDVRLKYTVKKTWLPTVCFLSFMLL